MGGNPGLGDNITLPTGREVILEAFEDEELVDDLVDRLRESTGGLNNTQNVQTPNIPVQGGNPVDSENRVITGIGVGYLRGCRGVVETRQHIQNASTASLLRDLHIL